jgi:hypothetical protein
MRFRRTARFLALAAWAHAACSGGKPGATATHRRALSTGDLDVLAIPIDPGMPATILVEDFDRDGRADVAVLPMAADGAVALQRDGQLVASPTPLAGVAATRRAITSDLDRDGDLDLLTACAPCAAGDTPVLALGEFAQSGAVRFSPLALPELAAAPADAGIPVAFDADGDGDEDLLLLSIDGTGGGTWLQNASWPGAPKFVAGGAPLPPLGTVTAAVAVQADGAGRLELYVARPGVDALLVLEADGLLHDRGAALGLAAADDEVGVARGDLDADGVDDVIRVAPDGTLTAVLVRPGGVLVEQALGALGPGDPTGVAVADVSGDGRADLIVPSASGPGAVLTFVGGPGVAKFAASAQASPGAAAGAPSARAFRPGRAAFAVAAAAGGAALLQTSSVDRDCDGLTDPVETEIFLDPGDPRDAEQDGDADGIPSLEEQRLGGNPWAADTDEDGAPDRADLVAGRDFDGDRRPTEHDACPRVVDRRPADQDRDGRDDACDPDIWGPGTPGLRAVRVLEHVSLVELAAETVGARDLSRVHGDLRGRLPTGESFLLFDGPPPHREAVDASGYVEGDEIVELYNERTQDHAYVPASVAYGLEVEGGYRRLRTLGWVSKDPVEALGKPRQLYRLGIWRRLPDGEMAWEEGITVDEGFRDQLVAEGYTLLGTLGWTLADEGRVRTAQPVVRFRRAGDAAVTLHSSAIGAEADVEGHVSDDVVFRIFPEATRHTRPLYRLRGPGGEELLTSDPSERAQLIASGAWRRDTAVGYLVPPGHVPDTLEELVPLFRFDPPGAPPIHTVDARDIEALAASGVPGKLLGLVVRPPAQKDASCPGTGPSLADRLWAIDDEKERARATLLGLVTACEVMRVARGDVATPAEVAMASMLAERADAYTLARVQATLAPWHALDAQTRADLLGPLAEFDPGDCSAAPDLPAMGRGMQLMQHTVPRTGVSLRQPMCQGVTYAQADPEGRGARALVTTDRFVVMQSTEFTTYQDFLPQIFGVQDTQHVRGHARLEQYAQVHPDVGLPVTGVPTGISCDEQLQPCDATQGLRCENKTCVAYPIVRNGTELELVGINFWDVMGPEVRLKRVGSGTPYRPAEVTISHFEDLASDEQRCAATPVLPAGQGQGLLQPPGGGPPPPPPPWQPPPVMPGEAALNRARVADFRPGAGAFYEVQFVNRNGHYFKHGELIPNDHKEQERLGRTIHVCWSPGKAPAAALGTVPCTPPTAAAKCGVPGGDGPACGAATGGQFTGAPRPLAACIDPNNAASDDSLCGETPITFASEPGKAYIYVEDTPPDSDIEIALEGVACHEETGADWPGDDEFYMLMFTTPGRIPDAPSWEDVVETEMWAGDFDTGSRWAATGGPGRGELKTRMRVAAPGLSGDTAGVLMVLAEDDDYVTEAIVGTIVIAAAAVGGYFLAPSVLAAAGGGAAAAGAWMGFLNLLPEPDDHLGSAGWFIRKDDVTDRGNMTHDGVLGWVPPIKHVPGGFSHNERDSVVSEHPAADFWAEWSNASLRLCSSGCQPGEGCYQGVCVDAGWDDSSWVPAPGNAGFVESRRFIEDPGDPDWDYEIMLRYVSTPAPL